MPDLVHRGPSNFRERGLFGKCVGFLTGGHPLSCGADYFRWRPPVKRPLDPPLSPQVRELDIGLVIRYLAGRWLHAVGRSHQIRYLGYLAGGGFAGPEVRHCSWTRAGSARSPGSGLSEPTARLRASAVRTLLNPALKSGDERRASQEGTVTMGPSPRTVGVARVQPSPLVPRAVRAA